MGFSAPSDSEESRLTWRKETLRWRLAPHAECVPDPLSVTG
jgi:hypothetical protein